MTSSLNKSTLEYIVTHVFLPIKLPQHQDHTSTNEHELARLVYNHAFEYHRELPATEVTQWTGILRMLDCFAALQERESYSAQDLTSAMSTMSQGDVTAIFVREQNASLLIRKQGNDTLFESFEVSAKNEDVLAATGKLCRTFPGPAIAVPNGIADDPLFRSELASYLSLMNTEILDSAATSTKAGVKLIETRNTTHPRYITHLLTGILRGMGRPADIVRINKRIADDVLWHNAKNPWRRSPVWTVLRVALQTSLAVHGQPQVHLAYKTFMISFMTYILELAVDMHNLSSQLIHCMRTKLARRLHKLDSHAPEKLSSNVIRVLDKVSSELQRRWSVIQASYSGGSLWAPETLDIYSDTFLTLHNSSSYLQRALNGQTTTRRPTSFNPQHYPRLRSVGLLSLSPEMVKDAFAADSPIALYDFEKIVRDNIDHWVLVHSQEEWAIENLSNLLIIYHHAASECYNSNPEDISLMFLTLFDLWVAIDKLAIAQCPLLKEYSPEIPCTLLEALLLRKSEPLGRFTTIASYLTARHEQADNSHPSILKFTHSCLSFAVRFFDSSSKLQSLKNRIECDAEAKRTAKEDEFNRLVQRQRDLSSQADAIEHKYAYNNGHSTHKKKKCPKCRLEKEISAMSITVHEWPLPGDAALASAVVFELQCPFPFRLWRDSTYHLLHDICNDTRGPGSPPIRMLLGNYPGLTAYKHQLTRLTIGSYTKSFYNTHYKLPKVGHAKISQVCLPNGLQFSLRDTIRDTWTKQAFCGNAISEYCTLQLPRDQLYSSLQFAVDGTAHTSNQMLSDQSNCPCDLSLHEFDAFVGLRSGHRVQWLNILRELRSRALTFRQESAHFLFLQSACQVGPFSRDGIPEAHSHDLPSAEFGVALLNELDRLHLDISANWLEIVTAKTIIILTTRLLTASSAEPVISKSIHLLRDIRKTMLKWARELAQKLDEAVEEKEIDELRHRVCEAAATCRLTFDVDEHHLWRLLSSDEDVSIAIEGIIRIYDNMPGTSQGSYPRTKQMLDRDRRLSWSLESRIKSLILISQQGADRAISAVWPTYYPGTPWCQLDFPNDRWISATTQVGGAREPQIIHLDTIAGRLLIDGKSAGRLSRDILQHNTYIRLFHNKVLDVMPSEMDGMQYASRSLVGGYQLFFALIGEDLTIRAKQEDLVLELIPHHIFRGDLPISFVDEHVHWLHLSGIPPHQSIELRPIDTPWSSSEANWVIHLSLCTQKSQMRRRDTALLDIRSRSTSMVYEKLKALDSLDHLHATCPLHCGAKTLSVDLPRYRLQFILDEEGELKSAQFPEMIVDPQPYTGTMVGLVNQLVLRPKNVFVASLSRTRRILVPQGTVSLEWTNGHSRVKIVQPPTPRLVYHEYRIDSDLGCLIGKASLFSKLYQAYLHALTSSSLPDPLTHRTGVEEALHILQSASSWSFSKLSADEFELLRGIDSVAPQFAYYPPDLRTMQSVQWSEGVSPLTQCPSFSDAARKMRDFASELELFNLDARPEEADHSLFFATTDSHLSKRYSLRYQYFYPSNSISFPALDDTRYLSRDYIDAANGVEAERRACTLSDLVLRWPSSLPTKSNLFEILTQLGSICASSNPISQSSDWLDVTIRDSWFTLYNTLRQAERSRHQFQLAFGLNIFAYRSPHDWELIPTLLAFATNPAFSVLPPPARSELGVFDFSAGFEPQLLNITAIIDQSSSRCEVPSSLQLARGSSESLSAFQRRCTIHQKELYHSQAKQLASKLVNQWPCRNPSTPYLQDDSTLLFRPSAFMPRVVPAFATIFYNAQFQDHVRAVQKALEQSRSPRKLALSESYQNPVSHPTTSHSYRGVQLQVLLDSVAGPPCPELPHVIGRWDLPAKYTVGNRPPLIPIIQDLADSQQRIHQVYAAELETSQRLYTSQIGALEILEEHNQRCHSVFRCILQTVTSTLSATLNSGLPSIAFEKAGLWPRLTPTTLLRLLASTSRTSLTPAWKDAIVIMSQALILYQRSQRLLNLALSGSWDELMVELENTHTGSGSRADWLLIQIEGNFMARSLQLDVAEAMISPPATISPFAVNTILQLNMGEGKSSVIVPFVAAEVANRTALCRVVVLKPLAGQMFRQLVERLGGLVNRRIFVIPFSRKAPVGPKQVTVIKKLFDECMIQQGVLVAQPEHILSFRLMTIDKLIHSSPSDYTPIFNCSRWLDSVCRDLLDESDEILQTRYQLIYTIGQQVALEDNPNRWITIQQIFTLIEECLRELETSMDIARQRRFPFIRHDTSGKLLIRSVSQLIMGGALPGLALGILSQELRDLVSDFITTFQATDHYERLRQETGGFWKGILLLRGLLAHGILLYVLKERRWRVDYGLDLKRTLLAVPYRAKDVPALRAEFGHPEVSICLTCLAYYYSGLTEGQLRLCFELLWKLDNPEAEYETWTRRDGEIPNDFLDLRSVNVEDVGQWSSLVERFSLNKSTIDFFLRSVVFPKEGKTFPQKLCTSGWDLAETRVNITTGFSGTNDNRYLLPTSIRQHDLGTLRSTNAKVLNYVLLPENNYYQCASGSDGRVLGATDLLELLTAQTPVIRVLLDVGAQMLELRNIELSRRWLDFLPQDVEAAVFFDEDDEIMVTTRDGDVSPFYRSPYFYQLDRCIVYLDDAHTRGTDLKLPTGSRAAVTLGPKVTKDRLIQGCMRMRKLGNGHTVMFFAPPEIDQSIRHIVGKSPHIPLEVSDIIRWAMHETCSYIEHNIPHWYSQGVDQVNRRRAWDSFLASSGSADAEVLRSAWLQPEAQTLEQMYGLRTEGSASIPPPPPIKAHLETLGLEMSFSSVRTVGEEQEREVSHEVELEREVQRPDRETPEKHTIHPAVQRLAQSGNLDTEGFVSVVKFFHPSNPEFKLWGPAPKLLATRDFMTTVSSSKTSYYYPSDYMRPVKWIVSHHATGYLIIFSPWETNELLPYIHASKAISLHIYSPRVTVSMRPFDDLRVYTVPPLPPTWAAPRTEVMCLNLIAGQLYLRDYDEYLAVCMFLGRYTGKDDHEIPKEVDGFIKPQHRREDMARLCGFTTSPIAPLKELVSARRKGMDYANSHLGKILNSAIVREKDFEPRD